MLIYLILSCSYAIISSLENKVDRVIWLFFLQITGADTPGIFRLWAMIGQELHSIKVNVPRIFYVNSRKQKEGEGASE